MPELLPGLPTDGPSVAMRGQHVGLRVADIDAAITWYAAVLDFRVLQAFEVSGNRFAYLGPAGRDDFQIELLGGHTTDPSLREAGVVIGGWDHLCLEVDDVDDAVSSLRSRGVTILREAFDVRSIGRRIAFFADPWGNRFELLMSIRDKLSESVAGRYDHPSIRQAVHSESDRHER